MDGLVKVVAIIQARMSSTRLPAKVMLDLVGKTVLERVVDRVRLAGSVDEIWIATSTNVEDDLIEVIAKEIGVSCYRGSLENVISRYYETAELTKADIIIRVTADNPLTEPSFIDAAVVKLISDDLDYVGFDNIPLGTGVEAFTMKSLAELMKIATLTNHNQEHVTSYYYQNPKEFKIGRINDTYFDRESQTRLTVDTLEDYVFMVNIYNEMLVKAIKPEKFMEFILSSENLGRDLT